MKKGFKLLTLVIAFFLVINLASCSSKESNLDLKDVTIPIVLDISTEDKVFLGYYTFDAETKTGTLYTVGASIPGGQYEEVFIDVKEEALPSYANGRNGLKFAGWYPTAAFTNGAKLSSLAAMDSDADGVIYAKYITYGDAGIIAVVCVIIVFSMLALLWGIVSLFKYIKPKAENKQQTSNNPVNNASAPVVNAPKQAFTIEDIKDEDMMVAALVATIDYHNETNEDVRVVSIKQIG